MNNWYEVKTGNHQGLVIEEGTGRNVAVTYDEKDAKLVALAPRLLELTYMLEGVFDEFSVQDIIDEARSIKSELESE